MAKLAELIEGMARALQVSPSRLRTAAAQLRKHKLLKTGPRGPGAPDMTPVDATNLLFAVMYDGELADAHETVPRLRSARVRYFEGSRSFEDGGERMKSPPRNGFITSAKGETYELGTVIDILLDAWVRFDCVSEGDDEDLDLEVVNIRLEVESPGYNARLTFNAPNGLFWRINYEWKSKEQIEYEAANKGNRLVRRWDALKGPYMSSSRIVGEDSLTKIADCLRGAEWLDEWESFTPPYEETIDPQPEVALA